MDDQDAIKILARYELAAELKTPCRPRVRPEHIPEQHWRRVRMHMGAMIDELEPKLDQLDEAVRVIRDPYEDAGDAVRRALGIDGTAEDARDIEHPYQTHPAGDSGVCLACGCTRHLRRHVR